MLRSNLFDYSDAYIIGKGRISVTGTDNANRSNKKLTLKDNGPFRSCISKINNAFTDNEEDFDTVMPMHNLWDILWVTIILWHQKVCRIIIEI